MNKKFLIMMLLTGLVAGCDEIAPAVSNVAAFRIEAACGVTHSRYYRLPNGGLEVTYEVPSGRYTAAKRCVEQQVPEVVNDPFPINNGRLGPTARDMTVLFGS